MFALVDDLAPGMSDMEIDEAEGPPANGKSRPCCVFIAMWPKREYKRLMLINDRRRPVRLRSASR